MSSDGAQAVVSDDQIQDILKSMLTEIDIASTSMREIRRILQERVGESFNVEDRKDFVKQIVESLLLGDDNDNEDDMCVEDKETVEQSSENTVSKRKGGGGFTKPLLLSEDLARFMGAKVASRTDVTKKIWEYIKANDLQNPANRREILCDETFEKLMKRKKVSMFKMTQVLNPMMKRMQDLQASCLSDSDDDSEQNESKKRKRGNAPRIKSESNKSSKKVAEDDAETSSNDDASSNGQYRSSKRSKTQPKKTAKNAKKVTKQSSTVGSAVVSDPLQPASKKAKVAEESESTGSGIYVHPDLLEALGVTEVPSRPQLVKKMWEYIRSQQLQNPADRREIVLDEALKKVFKVNKFTAFSMNRYLNNVVKKYA